MRKKLTVFAGALLAGLSFCGCMGVAPYSNSETVEPPVSFASPAAKSIAVLPFLDARPGGGTDGGSFYWGLLPLLPFCYVDKPYPERSDGFVSLARFHFNPADDLAASAMSGLTSSRLFEKVTFARTPAQAEDAEYIWRGTLTDSAYSGTMITYGITYFAAPVLWIVGAPQGVSTNTLGVRFELIRRSTDEVVWNCQFHGSDTLVHWIYARVGKDVSLYPDLMRRAMNRALTDLAINFPK